MERLANTCVNFVELPKGVTPCSKGVRYFVPKEGIELLKCAMDTIKEGQKYKKRIVVRPSRRRKGLHELYTYHFPTHWSAGCVANRELMAEARRQAHAIERDRTRAGLEWRIRFLKNYYSPEPEVKRYSHLFHFAYAVIQQEMRAAREAAEEVTFEPIVPQYRKKHNEKRFFLHNSKKSCTFAADFKLRTYAHTRKDTRKDIRNCGIPIYQSYQFAGGFEETVPE